MNLVVGAGAIGSLFAVHLSQVSEVIIFDIDSRHIAAIAQDGLSMNGAISLSGKMRATTDPAQLKNFDIDTIIIATKCLHTRAALESIRPYVADPLVISVQNGVGNDREIEAAGFSHVVLGMTRNAAELTGPGQVVREMVGPTWIGPVSKVSLNQAEQVAALLTQGGMETRAMANPWGYIWGKTLFNAAVNPVTALSQIPSRYLVHQPNGRALMESVLAEGLAVVDRLKVTLPFDPAASALGDRPPGQAHMSSMGQDVRQHRLTEVDFLNGAIVRYGEKVGIACPVNGALVQLIHLVEQSWSVSELAQGFT